MRASFARRHIAFAIVASLIGGVAAAKLPSPTPEQQQAAEAKKQQAAAQTKKEKQELADAMEKVTSRWRTRADAQGWETHPPVPIAQGAGFDASAAQSSPSGQPGGQLGSAAAAAPIRSEKAGTAPPSEDVKNPAKKGK